MALLLKATLTLVLAPEEERLHTGVMIHLLQTYSDTTSFSQTFYSFPEAWDTLGAALPKAAGVIRHFFLHNRSFHSHLPQEAERP